jgi:hypothetical protein
LFATLLLRAAAFAVLLLAVFGTCRNRITLYANITGVAFEYSSLGELLLQATVSDSVRGEVRPVSIDRSQPTFALVNKLWDEIPCPSLE